ncbi:MAG: TadE/TadG family type IV pilus assembly protein [Oscillospiraceae bacterium]
MTNAIREKFKSERGLVIVEASIVFPVMFIILFFLIYFGNAYYEKAKIDDIVVKNAILGAGYCADPILQVIKDSGDITFPEANKLDSKPYRYIFGGMKNVETEIKGKVQNEIIGASNVHLFKVMHPQLTTNNVVYNNHIVAASFSVEVGYSLYFPIKLLGAKEREVLKLNSRAEIPLSDTAEFMRNTDMVIDMTEKYFSKGAAAIQDVFGKVNEFVTKFPDKEKEETK